MTTNRQMRDAQLIIDQAATIDRLTAALTEVHASIDAMCCLDDDVRDAACRAAGHEPCGASQTSYMARSAAPSEETDG